ncbi:MAG: histidine phosphatase family protein [Desulfobacteraceae bacterium]|nr:histidine phosphatase family protein [Desulfobacteraceae bacterium]
MKPKRIILIRHGESQGNAERKSYESIPDYQICLTDKGREQAFAAGKKIKEIVGSENIYAYISPFYRTRQTYVQVRKFLADNIVKSIEDPRLREMDWGHLRPYDENKEIIRERDEFGIFYYRIPDGESGADVYDRISTFLETMHRDFVKQDYPANSLIITHGVLLRLFLMRWFHWSVEEFENLKNPKNCQIVVMEKQDDDSFKLISELERKR